MGLDINVPCIVDAERTLHIQCGTIQVPIERSDSGVDNFYEACRRLIVPPKQLALPVLQAVDAIIICEFRRASDEEAITDFFFILVLGPTIAVLAKRHFVPLSSLVIVANFRELLAVPYRFSALFEDVADIRALKAIKATDRHRAIIVHWQSLVQRRAWQALLRWLHVGERAILEKQIDAHAIDETAPALDECRLLMPVFILQT